MSSEASSLVRGIGFLGVGNIISSLFLVPVQVAAVRMLGPGEVGKYVLVLVIVDFLVYFMLMGLHASIEKHLPDHHEDEDAQRTVVTTCVSAIVVLSCVALVLYTFLRVPIMHYLNIPAAVLVSAQWFSCFFAIKLVTESVLRGRLQFRQQAMLDIVAAVVVFAVFFALFFLEEERRFSMYIYAMWAGIAAYTIIAVSKNWRLFRPRCIDGVLLRTFLAYGLYSVLGSVSLFVVWNSDRFFLNKFFGVGDVGVYAVYYGASLMVLGRAVSIVMKALLPMASKNKDRPAIDRKISTLMKLGIVPLVAVNGFFMWGMLLVYGTRYQIRISWIILFALNAVLYAFINVRGAVLAADGARGMRCYAQYAFGAAVIAYTLNALLIPRFGITGGIIAATTVSTLFFLGISLRSHSYFRRSPTVSAAQSFTQLSGE